MKQHKSVATIGALLLAIGSVGLLSTPAQAANYDVSGIQLDFSNASPIGENAALNDEFRYLNVATVNGTQIDATVTVVAIDNLVTYSNYLFLDDAMATSYNGTFSGKAFTAGCWWNPTYAVSGDPADLATPDDLLPARVDMVDGSEDVEDGKAINTDMTTCQMTGKHGEVKIRVAFTTGEAKTAVTLEKVSISATDIDNTQTFTLLNPKPSSFKVYSPTKLTVTEDANQVAFYGEDASDDAENQLIYVADATYDSVSSLDYIFASELGGGSLSVAFKSVAWDGLADTGAENGNTVLIASSVAGAGAVLLFASALLRRKRR